MDVFRQHPTHFVTILHFRFCFEKKTFFCGSIFEVFLLFSLLSVGQNITGIVSDENGVPLPGANVVIDGTSTGVSTDFDGNFEILLKIGDKIQISYIGKKTIELPILTSPISIYLETDLNELDEVTVSVGYFDISEKDLSGSTCSSKIGSILFLRKYL